MNEKLAKKLKKILAKAGLDEDKIDEIVEEVVEATTEEEVINENDNPDNVTPDQPSEETQVEETPAPTNEEVPPVQEEVPPTDGNIEQALQELAAQEQGEVPPTDAVPPTQEQAPVPPVVDPSATEELKASLREANKTIEGLTARIDSLEQALKAAGVITSESKLGDETPRITPNANQENVDVFDDVLATINGK